MGWNTPHDVTENDLTENLETAHRYYFVHSTVYMLKTLFIL